MTIAGTASYKNDCILSYKVLKYLTLLFETR